MSSEIPAPDVMPVDREEWFRQLHLSNFVNTYYQYRDLQRVASRGSVLIVGPGQGLDTHVLKWRGYEITTLDIDTTFRPDFVGSIHDMSFFSDQQFDAVVASHVIEHQAEPYLDRSLRELARVGRHCLIYLPVAGRHVQLRFNPAILSIDISLIVDLFNYFHKPDGVTPRYCQGQHFWEVGMRGWRVKDLIRRFNPYFEIVDVYRNRDWTPSQNFVLRSKRG